MKLRKLIYSAALMLGVVACGEDVSTDIKPNVSEGRLSLEISSMSERLTLNSSGSEGEVVFLTRGGELFVDVVTNAEGEEVKVHLYERTRGDGFPNAPTSSSAHTDCFAGCQGLSDYANIPEDWK